MTIADPNTPACPLHLIPDAATRSRETTRQAFERIAPHLILEVRQRLRALPTARAGQIIKRIVLAERKKETMALATPTPSPKQRRALARADTNGDDGDAPGHITKV